MENPSDTPPDTLPPQAVEPALVVQYTKVRLHPEDIERVLTDKLPGYIPFFTQAGTNFPGCRLIHFDAFGNIKGLDADVLEHYLSRLPTNKYGTSNIPEAVNFFFAKPCVGLKKSFPVRAHFPVLIYQFTVRLMNIKIIPENRVCE